MDIGDNYDRQFVHLIHETSFLPPIYPQITPMIFHAFSSVLKKMYIPQAARTAGKDSEYRFGITHICSK
jgi:hypothetical protein